VDGRGWNYIIMDIFGIILFMDFLIIHPELVFMSQQMMVIVINTYIITLY